jgi:hypothetical protein
MLAGLPDNDMLSLFVSPMAVSRIVTDDETRHLLKEQVQRFYWPLQTFALLFQKALFAPLRELIRGIIYGNSRLLRPVQPHLINLFIAVAVAVKYYPPAVA